MKKAIFITFLCLFSRVCALMPNVLLCGAPGSGKGTFSQYLLEHYQYHHISCGDLLRHEVEAKTPLGQSIEASIRRGENIDQTIIYTLIRNKITAWIEENDDRPFIIDGLIRKEEGIYFFRDLIHSIGKEQSTLMVTLECDDNTCMQRVLTREICPGCDWIYNTRSRKSVQQGICDRCFSPLQIRLNDTPEVISKRIKDYRTQTTPLEVLAESYFQHERINTEAPLETVFKNYEEWINTLLDNPGLSPSPRVLPLKSVE